MEQAAAKTPRLRHGIAEEVRVLLARRRMSATKLSEQLGWSQPYMARRMSGAQPFDADDLEAIADALDVDVLDLMPSRRSDTNQEIHLRKRSFGGTVRVGVPIAIPPRREIVRVGGITPHPDHPLVAGAMVISSRSADASPPPGPRRARLTGL